MPAEPRIVPVPCPFESAGGLVYVYYIDAPQPALVDTGVAASPSGTIEPRARMLVPIAEKLGLPSDPSAWPPSLFPTLHGHLKAAAAAV